MGPSHTAVASELRNSKGAVVPTSASRDEVVAAAGTDSDSDGLTDTEESWWCTNPNNPRTNGNPRGYTDGQAVYGLLDFTLPRSVRYGYGPPFGPPNAWPAFNQPGGCVDGDRDTIPDQAEAFMVGTNYLLESTARDKFDDGQKLFGITYCPGGSNSCGYGSYPRPEYSNFITASMPSWVLPPADNPFVAAFPVPQVHVVQNSLTITKTSTITTQQGTMTQAAHTYQTSVANGVSTSVSDSRTWNDWQEVSHSVSRPGTDATSRAPAPNGLASDSFLSNVWDTVVTYGPDIAVAAGSCAAYVLTDTLVLPAGVVCLGSVGQFFNHLDAEMSGADDNTQPQDDYTSFIYDGFSIPGQGSVMLSQPFDTQGLASSIDGVQYAISQQGEVLARRLEAINYAITQPRVTNTQTSGRSWGGAQTTTSEKSEVHTVTDGQSFATGENWSTAWAMDSSHAGDLTFNYTVSNIGSDYAREITNVDFNIFLGEDATPIITYPAWQQFPNGTLTNVFPGASLEYASNPIRLTLDQMRRIDLGEVVRVVLNNVSFGADQLFYQDSTGGGVTVFVDDGTTSTIQPVRSFVMPTWGTEPLLDVLSRYFPIGRDANGEITGISTPILNGANPPTWQAHPLTETSWWNFYLTQDIGAAELKDVPAQAASSLFLRLNRDADRDGYSDRVERQHGTDPNKPASHPRPQIVAASVSDRVGDNATTTLALENLGDFDATSVQATMYSPDDSTTVTNNVVGGNGVVHSGQHVAVGSQLRPPDLTGWGSNISKPYVAGSYGGSADRTYTFTVANAGVVGQGTTSTTWTDGTGGSGSLDLGSSYHAPLPIAVANGVTVGFQTGAIAAGTSFRVLALTPRDTFQYTVNRTPFTPPVIAVSYSDPQGSHRFVTPVSVPSLTTSLAPYQGQMLFGLNLDIRANAEVTPAGSQTTSVVMASPDVQTIQNAQLHVDVISNGSKVLSLPFTMNVERGPTIFPFTWNPSSFSSPYDASADNIMIVTLTDVSGNIVASSARPLRSFTNDPLPVLNVPTTAIDFGAVVQGAMPSKYR